jgi:hypothetical protein
MFQFIYKGKFNCLITKDVFETHIEQLYDNMKKMFGISWSPKKFIVTMEIDPKKSKGWGGNTNYDFKTNTFLLTLQLFGFSKNEQTISIIEKLFGYVLTHEMLHFFIPYVQNNSCWSEGVTDFMTFWYTDTISENLFRLKKEYKEITDPSYKQHKFGYLSGFKKMVKLYEDDPSVITDMKRIIKDFNKNDKNRQKIYTHKDIIEYNPKFVGFFIGKCNTHVKHEL